MTEKHVGGPLILTDYPSTIKPFYMRVSEDGKTVAAMDVLVPGVGEIIGGSQREERLDVLLSRMDHAGLSQADYDWYIDLRRFGTVPHAGFGLGLERAVQYATGMAKHPRRDPVPKNARQRRFLIGQRRCLSGQRRRFATPWRSIALDRTASRFGPATACRGYDRLTP